MTDGIYSIWETNSLASQVVYTRNMTENKSDDRDDEQVEELLESEAEDDRDSEELKACGE